MSIRSSQSSAKNLNANALTIDANILRKVLRLIHCLQKERGSSCAYTAVSSTSLFQTYIHVSKDDKKKQKQQQKALLKAAAALSPIRQDTDTAFTNILLLLTQNASSSSSILSSVSFNLQALQTTLFKLRKTIPVIGVDGHTLRSVCQPKPQDLNKNRTTSPTGFHRILVCYNTIIQSIVHDYVLKYTRSYQDHETHTEGEEGEETDRFSPVFPSLTPPHRRRRNIELWYKNHRTKKNGMNTNGLRGSRSHQALSNIPNDWSDGILTTNEPMMAIPSSDPERITRSAVVTHTKRSLVSTGPPPELLPLRTTGAVIHRSYSSESDPNADNFDFYDTHDCSEHDPTKPSNTVTNLGTIDDAVAAVIAESEEILAGDDDNHSEASSSTSSSSSLALDEMDAKLKLNKETVSSTKLVRLLHLLDLFVRLKESTGVERATVCSIMAAGKIESRLLLNDLVMEAENHRQQLDKILWQQKKWRRGTSDSTGSKSTLSSSSSYANSQPITDNIGVLQDLIHEMVTMSPAMEQLQNAILQGFNVNELKERFRDDDEDDALVNRTNTKLWNLLTLYIDKLHSLELLIVEEIECCLDAANSMKNINNALQPPVTTASTVKNSSKNVVPCNHQGSVVDGNLNTLCSSQRGVGGKHLMGMHNNSVRMNIETKNDIDDCPQDVDPAAPNTENENQIACTSNDNYLLTALGMKNDSDPNSIIHTLQTMRPDELQQKLIGVIQQYNQPSNSIGNIGFNLNGPGICSLNNQVQQIGDNGGMLPTSRAMEDLLREISIQHHAPASKEWEIDLYEIQFRKRIGQGSAGTTYLADWTGLPVAVKVASISEMGLDGWRTEVQALQKLHHPNIIRLLGSVCHPNPLTFCLVLEYCDAGDLATALLTVTPKNFFFQVASGTAKGMTYLHSRGVIHRDIKPSNILLHGNVASGLFQVKVTDFGVATETTGLSTRGGTNRTAETGTYRWMAPEVIRHEKYSKTADVYSFAIVLWQLLTREEPFHGRGQIEAAAAVAIEMLRPPLPEQTPSSIRQLIETCWSGQPSERLFFDQIDIELNQIEKFLTEDEMSWLQAPLGHWVYRKKRVLIPDTQPNYVPDGNNDPKQLEALGENNSKLYKKKGTGLRTLFARKHAPRGMP